MRPIEKEFTAVFTVEVTCLVDEDYPLEAVEGANFLASRLEKAIDSEMVYIPDNMVGYKISEAELLK